jgi:hypothetical protein
MKVADKENINLFTLNAEKTITRLWPVLYSDEVSTRNPERPHTVGANTANNLHTLILSALTFSDKVPKA